MDFAARAPESARAVALRATADLLRQATRDRFRFARGLAGSLSRIRRSHPSHRRRPRPHAAGRWNWSARWLEFSRESECNRVARGPDSSCPRTHLATGGPRIPVLRGSKSSVSYPDGCGVMIRYAGGSTPALSRIAPFKLAGPAHPVLALAYRTGGGILRMPSASSIHSARRSNLFEPTSSASPGWYC